MSDIQRLHDRQLLHGLSACVPCSGAPRRFSIVFVLNAEVRPQKTRRACSWRSNGGPPWVPAGWPAHRQLRCTFPCSIALFSSLTTVYRPIVPAENVHEPGLKLAQRLLSTVGAGWAARAFFSDDGSTAIEIALKMAFRKYLSDSGLLERPDVQLQVRNIRVSCNPEVSYSCCKE